jgi:CheY-like chemotaxis protein
VSTVLIVDDESSVRFLLKMIFENAGYEVIEAHHGAAALERMTDVRPDLIVTDLMMPVMDGRALIARLRSNTKTAPIPILAVTAELTTQSHGADALITKPFDPDDLVETARGLGEGD